MTFLDVSHILCILGAHCPTCTCVNFLSAFEDSFYFRSPCLLTMEIATGFKLLKGGGKSTLKIEKEDSGIFLEKLFHLCDISILFDEANQVSKI